MSVVSKNPFDLLGDDGDESPAPKAAPKAAAPAAEAKPKRDVPGATSKAPAGGNAQRGARYPSRGGPRNVFKGDRSPPAQDNVPEGTETGVFDGERAPPSRKGNHNHVRDAHTKGPRGSRPAKNLTSGGHTSSRSNIGGGKTPAQGGERRQFERRSGTIPDSQKKVDQGWGANEGSAELTAEVEGQTDAITEEKADAAGPEAVETDAAAPAEEEEPEEVQKSLDEYLAERASAGLEGILGKKEGRTVTADKLQGTQFVREGIDEFFHGKEKTAAAKAKAPKKEKVFIEFDGQFARPAGEREQRGERREGGAGGRGGARGGARGGRGQGPRGGARGGQTGGQGQGQRAPRSQGQAIDANDTSAFPALGA